MTREWLVLLGLAVLVGCSDSKTPAEAEPAKTEPRQTVEPTELQDGVPDSPEATMRQMVEGLKQNRPIIVWQAMPKRFQEDINGLVRDFAKKMDPVLWEQSFETGEKLARLLARKKSEILSHPELSALTPESRRRLETHWDGLVELLAILVQSELSDLGRLESFDMSQFLEKTGGRWLSQLGALSESLGQDSLSGMLAGLEPKTLSLKDDKAVMGWMAAGSDVPVSQFSLIKVEGRWIPAGWVPAWEQIQAWRGVLRQTSAESFTRQSGEKIATLKRAESAIDQLLATKTADEFHETLSRELGEPAVKELAGLVRLMSGEAAPAPVSEPPTPPAISPNPSEAGTVTLIINGATPDDEDRIFDVLAEALPGDVDVQFDRNRTGLKVIAGPVSDLDAFKSRLTFGTITKMDADQRLFHIEMKR